MFQVLAHVAFVARTYILVLGVLDEDDDGVVYFNTPNRETQELYEKDLPEIKTNHKKNLEKYNNKNKLFLF